MVVEIEGVVNVVEDPTTGEVVYDPPVAVVYHLNSVTPAVAVAPKFTVPVPQVSPLVIEVIKELHFVTTVNK